MENSLFSYNGNNITLRKENGNVYVNATEMAKSFNKRTNDWLSTKQSIDLISSLSAVTGIPATGLVSVNQGGTNQGTWMYEDVALLFAQWLSPEFYILCNGKIKELLKQGYTTLDTINRKELARMILEQEEEKERLQLLIQEKTEQLDESKEWYTIKRYAKEHKLNWRGISWRALKAISYEHGYEIRKIFDGNYGQVNLYHIDTFKIYLGIKISA